MSERKKKKTKVLEKILTREEILQFDINSLVSKNKKHETNVIEYDIRLLEFKKEIISRDLLIIDGKIREKQYEKKEKIDNFNVELAKNREYSESLKEKYKVTSEKWGFDTDTGEIKED